MNIFERLVRTVILCTHQKWIDETLAKPKASQGSYILGGQMTQKCQRLTKCGICGHPLVKSREISETERNALLSLGFQPQKIIYKCPNSAQHNLKAIEDQIGDWV
jgi:hypothetical protein